MQVILKHTWLTFKKCYLKDPLQKLQNFDRIEAYPFHIRFSEIDFFIPSIILKTVNLLLHSIVYTWLNLLSNTEYRAVKAFLFNYYLYKELKTAIFIDRWISNAIIVKIKTKSETQNIFRLVIAIWQIISNYQGPPAG